ncbi:MAG: glycosyltransferase family 4 protein [Betaproteobacteria bacterium]|nr:glycosyltransferase family 4 protein [Betaproteobacteria bacterium]
MRPRVHFHSDCPYFAGCENMLVNFFHDDRLMREFEVSFTYRQSAAYDAGFRSRVARDFDVRPLGLKDVAELDARVQRLPAPLGWLLRLTARVLLFRYWFVLWNTWLLYRTIGNPDLLHVNNGNYPGAYSCMAAVFAARLRGIRRIVYVANNVAIPYCSVQRWLDYPFDRLVAATVSIFVTASRHAGTELQKVLRLPLSKVINIHNGIAPRPVTEDRGQTSRRLGIPAGRVLIGVVAIIEERKGHLVLLDAVRRLKKHGQGGALPFIIIEGTGSEVRAVNDYVARHGLGDDVRLIGSEPNIFNLLNAVDAIALPSVSHEDFPNVVLEAMSLGKPVIASRLAGIPEQIGHRESGLLVEPRDSAGLAEAMRELAADAALREQLGRNARRRFSERFTADAAVAGYLSLYRRVLST